jgi:L-lysine exporter family protein LysE/ArgO
LLEVIRWFGVAYLSWFGFKSARAAFKNESLDAAGAAEQSRVKVVTTVLALTLLNPHVYLDTVILVGSIGNQFGENKWFFGVGAMLASVVWFTSVGYGAKAASSLMSKPIFWRVLDTVIAVIMFGIAITLAFYRFS